MFLSLLFSCQHTPITPKEEVQQYSLHMEGVMEDPTEEGVLDTVSVDMLISLVPFERFSDDSMSYTMLVREASMEKNGTPQETDLVGKWVRPRAFDFGELLSVEHMDDWSYEDSYIQSFDIMWFALYPNPPNMKKGETRLSLARYPLRFVSLQKGRTVLNNQWELKSVGKSATLSYTGKTDIRGRWNDWTQSGKGTVSGEIISSAEGGIPKRHIGEMSRKMCYTKESQVCQKQTFRFTLEQQP